jgi:opacity protein-like surface antigen
VGAGVEQKVTDHLSVRAEYVYDDFGHQTYLGDGQDWNDRRIAVRHSNLRVGASYRF